MKLSQGIDTFLIAKRAENLSGQTVEWYRKRLNPFISFFENCEVSAITADDLRRFVVYLQERQTKYAKHPYHKPTDGKLSAFTVHGYVRCVKTLFNWLEENEHIAQNVSRRLKKPKLPQQAPKEISQGDLLAILDAAKTWGRYPKRNYAMLLFLAESGCRVAGLISVRVSQLDLRQKRVLIVEKGNKERWLFFGNDTRNALKTWLSERPNDTDYLFVSERGQLTDWGVRMVLRHLGKVAGVKGRINPHSFRHAFAMRTYARSMNLSGVSQLMGHSSEKVTRDAYVRFSPVQGQQFSRKYATLGNLLHQKRHSKKIGQLPRKGKKRQQKNP